jgi:hypothetical protein
MSKIKKYKVRKIDIHHNGKLYPEGSEICLSSSDAGPLLGFLEESKDT